MDDKVHRSAATYLSAARTAGLLVLLGLIVPVALNQWREWQSSRELGRWLDAHREQAATARAAGEHLRAEKILEEAVRAAPTNSELRLEYFRSFVTRAAEQPQTLASGELEALGYAADLLEKLTQPEAIPALAVARGRLLLRQNRLTEAREALTAAIAAAPGYTHGHLALANLERAAGRPLEALAALEQALAADGENLNVINNLGVQYVELNRVEDGLRMFEKSVTVRDNTSSRMNAADALARLKRVPEAIAHLQAAVGLDAGSADLHRRLGRLLLQSGRADEAEQALTTSLRLHDDPATAVELARAMVAAKHAEQALVLYDALIKADPNNLDALKGRASALGELGRQEEASDAFQLYWVKSGRSSSNEAPIKALPKPEEDPEEDPEE